MFKKNFLVLVIIAFFVPISLLSQSIQENQIFLKGTVTDKYTGKPVYCDIEIRPEGGTKFKIFSDPVSGHYEQLIKGGTSYEFIFYRYNVLRQIIKVDYPTFERYREEEANYQVITLTPGVTAYEVEIFEPNSATIKESAKQFFEDFKLQLRFHRTVTWDLLVVGTELVKGKTVINKGLTQKRVDALTTYLENYKAYLKKLNIKASDYIKDNGNSLIIKVNQIEPPLEEQFTK
ncbi:MAG: hypothetical protein WCR42_08850 [bacterium]